MRVKLKLFFKWEMCIRDSACIDAVMKGTCYLFKHLNSSPKFLVVPGVGDFADRQIYLSMI